MSLNRRHCLQAAAQVAVLGIFPRTAFSQTKTGNDRRLKFGILGINHEHIFRMVQAIKDGGGAPVMAYAPNAEPQLAEKFFRENPQVTQARTENELLDNKDIPLVVNALPPAARAQAGERIMRAGKDCLADKGGILTLDELRSLRLVQAETKRRYIISYSERLLMPVSLKIDELLQAGVIGRVTEMIGVGPHGLTHNPREEWFWTRAGHGGILVDVATHQADQFLHYTRSTKAEVTAAKVANRENPEHPEFEDWGETTMQGDGGKANITVSFYRKSSTGFLLTLIGTEGKMEVQKHSGRITLTDAKGQRREVQADLKAICPFGRQVVDDVLNRTETAQGQTHAFLATELAIRAQARALADAKQ